MESYEQAPKRRFEQSEILDIFAKYAEGRDLKVDRILEDENGIYLLEASRPEEDGEKVEYNFARKGKHPEALVERTSIDRTYYDSDGIPYTGGGLLFFNDDSGEWQEA